MLFSSTKRNKLVLILDIESTVVNGILVLESKGEKPRVLFTHRSGVTYQPGLESSGLIETMMKATKETIDETVKFIHAPRESASGIPKRISEVHYVLSSPWILSESKRIEKTFEKAEVVTSDMVEDLIRVEREKLTSGKEMQGKVTQVEEKIFNVEINGYSLCSWHGKKAESLAISFVASVSGSKTVERFRDACAFQVRANDVFFHSSLLMQYIGIGELWNEKDTYTIIHIHGEITDIVAVSQHVCSFFASYPTGLQTITRSVAESSGMGKETTKSMMRTGTINTNDQKWVDELEKALKASPTPYDDYVTFVVLATERQQDFVQLIRQKFPKAHVEALTFDGLLTVALEKLRL